MTRDSQQKVSCVDGAILREMLGERRLDRDLDAICRCCMTEVSDQRYGGAIELLRDLERYRRGDDVRARRASVAERGWRVLRRHPSLTLAEPMLVFSRKVSSAMGAEVEAL